jgi:hypothetical protein
MSSATENVLFKLAEPLGGIKSLILQTANSTIKEKANAFTSV